MKTMEQGIMEIMAILEEGNGCEKIENGQGAGGAHVHSGKSTKSDKSANGEAIATPTPLETVYDGQGHVISTNGKKAHTGYVKGARKAKNPKDTLRADLVLATQVVLERSVAFKGKTGMNSVEGLVVRMADADYCIKVAGHAKAEFASREANFVPTKSYLTRGKAENHSPAIAKLIVAEIENRFPCASFGGFEIEGLITLLDVKASTIRIEIQKPNMVQEFSFKITKKRARVVLS